MCYAAIVSLNNPTVSTHSYLWKWMEQIFRFSSCLLYLWEVSPC